MRRPRTLVIATAVVAASAFALTACSSGGSSGGDSDSKKVADSTDVNAQPASKLKDGGTLRFALGSFGPDWNSWNNDGNADDIASARAPMDSSGCWNTKVDGSPTLNKDFCTSVKEDVSGGKQTITFELNDKAKFNDGTPINVDTFTNQWKILTNKDSNIVVASPYDKIESIEKGKSDKEVIVKTKETYEPYQDFFGGLFSQQINTPEIFNSAQVDKLNDGWLAGPFKIESFDNTQKSIIEVPNEKWWGEKPKLDKIVFKQYETNATIPAFKNGQIDVTSASSLTRMKQVQNVKGTEIRKGNGTNTFGFIFNTKSDDVKDIAVRKAFYQAINRAQQQKVLFQGMNWKSDVPGSWMLMPISKGYQDNYPVKDSDAKGAAKTLEDAGYKKDSSGYYAKDGKEVTVPIVNFNEDPIKVATLKAAVQDLKKAGIKASIDQRASQDFNKTFVSGNWSVSSSGYAMGGTIDTQPSQYYASEGDGNMTHCGNADINKKVASFNSIVDATKRVKAANDIEKEWQKACYAFLPVYNSPSFSAVPKNLANFGPALFTTRDWSMVGFVK